ncbi:hypothetical protein QUB56_21135 [Microcoleus sp. AR_TQ3_B6]|uniref:hypothetical protein n=1 Tax=Microcoleus sp. AR_TQ3_B6 TaxID=3055284 RepID=UPI002FD25D38
MALISQTMLKQSRHLRPNLLDIADLKNDELDCGFGVIIHNNNIGGSINSHHTQKNYSGQFKAAPCRTALK